MNKFYRYLFVLPAIGLLIFFSVNIIRQKPFSDDWMMLEIAREMQGKPVNEWLTMKDHFNVWRPLPYMLKALYLNGNKGDLTGYNFFKLLFFLGILMQTYVTVNMLFKDNYMAVLAVLLFLVNPTIIGAVQNIDHIYKLTGTFFFGMAVFSLYMYLERQNTANLAGFILFQLAAFFSDGDAVAIFPAVIIIMLFLRKKIAPKTSYAICGISLAMLAAYFYSRSVVVGGVLSGRVPGRQDIVLGVDALYNIAKMLGSSLIFTMSPYIYLRQTAFIVMGSFFLAANLALIVAAIIKSEAEARRAIYLMLGLSLTAMIPFILIRHVSEIYTLRPAYLLMGVLAYAAVSLYRQLKGGLKIALSMYLAVMFASGAMSMVSKQDMILRRGEKAALMAESMLRILPSPPKFSKINLLIGDCGVKSVYSDFINNDVQLAQVNERYDDFIRYNYNNSTLNADSDSGNIFNLIWDCRKQEFSLIGAIHDSRR